jgi:hypothetical protein
VFCVDRLVVIFFIMACTFFVLKELALGVLQKMMDVVLHVHITGRYGEEYWVFEGKWALSDEVAQGFLSQHRHCFF